MKEIKRKMKEIKRKKNHFFKFQFSLPKFSVCHKTIRSTPFPFQLSTFHFKKTRLCQNTAETKYKYIRQTKPILLDNLEPNERKHLYTCR